MIPAPLCFGVQFGASMLVFSAEGNKTQIYAELQSSGWDGCHYLRDRSCPQLYQSPSYVHLVSTTLCILTPQDVVFCFSRAQPWKRFSPQSPISIWKSHVQSHPNTSEPDMLFPSNDFP